MKLFNKGLSFILAMILVFSSVYTPAFANETETTHGYSEEELIEFVEDILNNGDVLIQAEDMPEDVLNELESSDSTEVLLDENGNVVSEEPTTEKPTTEEPITEEPTTEEPTIEEPTTEEPTIEEPTTEEPTIEEPTTEEPATEEKVGEEIIVDNSKEDINDPKYDEIKEPIPETSEDKETDEEEIIVKEDENADVELMFWWPWEYKNYETTANNVKAMSKASSKSTLKATYSKGTILKIVDSKKNSAGNLWYKTEKGYWIYSGNLRKHSCSATTPSTKKWYEKKNNDKHVYKTERAAAVCRCGETVSKKSKTSDTQNHSWNDVGKCTKCGHKYTFSLSTLFVKGEYMVKNNITLKNEPYSASGSAGSLSRYDIVNIAGSAKNAFGNKWYKTTSGKWIYESNIEKHSHSSYTDTGYCACGKAISYSEVNIGDTTKELTSSYTSKKIPFPSAGGKTSYSSGHVVVVVAASAWINPSWYKTSNGGWIPSSKLKNHSHNYSGGICQNSGCGVEFELKEKSVGKNGKGVLYETTGANKTLKVAPYSNRATSKTLSKSGTVIKIVAYAKNSHGNKWYKTSDKKWIYEDSVREHSHKTVSGRCTSEGCGYDYGVKPTTFSPTTYIVTKADSPTYNLPYSDSTKLGTLKKDSLITLNAEFKNLPGNLWYRTNTGRWIYSGNVEKHTHKYNKGKCSCGTEQPITLKSMVPTTYVTTENNVSVWARPYSNSGKKKTLQTKGTGVTIVGSTVNDADNLWYKTTDGYWIYSGNLKKGTSGTIVNTNKIPLTKYLLKVVDENKKAIVGATVKFGSQSATTGTGGYAELNYVTMKDTLTVSATNYDTHTEALYEMSKFKTDTITIVKSGNYVLTKANLTYKGTTTDVRNKELTLNQASNGLNFDLSLASNVKNVKEYRIVQDGKTIKTSVDGKFTNLSADSFKKNKSVVVHVVDNNNNVKVNTKLLLNVIYSVGDTPDTLSFGKSMSLKLDKSLPFPFSGMSVNVAMPTLPLNVDVNEDYLRVGINFKLYDSSEDMKSKETKWNYIKRLNKNKFKDFYKANAIVKPDSKKKTSSPFAWELKVGGYAEGSISSSYLKGNIFVAVECDAWKEAQLLATPPICGEISFEGSIQADGTIQISKVGFSGNLDLSLEVGMGLYAGLGGAGVASIGVYGKGSVETNVAILPAAYLDSISATASFGLKAKLFGKTIWDAKIIQLGDYYLYRRGASLEEYTGNYQDMTEFITNTDAYETMDRSYLNERSGWYEDVNLLEDEEIVLSQFDFDTLQSNTYTDIKPQIATTSHTIMMVYLDDNAERAADDRTMLVYSLFNKDTEQWTAPQAVYDDTTADFNFDVYSTGDEIYIVWQNATELLTSDLSVEAISKKTDLMIAKFDEAMGSFQNIETITKNNDDYEIMPRVASVNDKTIVAWFVNSADDVFGMNGTNIVHYAMKNANDYAPPTNYNIDESGILPEGTELDEPVEEEVAGELPEEIVPDEWIDVAVEGEQPTITSLAAGYMLDKGYIAFTIDEDGDYLTVDDQLVKLIDVLNPEIVSYTDKAMNVEFTTVHGDNALTWFNEGYIYYSLDAESAPQMLYTEAGIPNDEYHIISSESGNMAILYTVKGDNMSDAYVILYDDETFEWGLPVRVTQQDKYIQNFNGAYYDEMIVSIFNQTEVNATDMFEKNNLCCAIIGERYDLVLEDVIFDDIDLKPLESYPMTIKVKNNGTVRTSGVRVSIYADDELVEEKTVTTSIRPGETINVDTTITMPSEVIVSNYVIMVEQEESNDADVSNNRHEMTIGKALFTIDAEHDIIDDKNLLYVKVTNTGYEISSGSIVLYDENYNIDKILYDNIDELGYGESFTCTVEFTSDDFDGEMYKTFCVGVIPTAEQSTDEYNTTTVLAKNATVPEEAQVDVNTVNLTETEDEISLMGEFKKNVSGQISNESENDISNAKICVVAYDGRGIYLDTQIVEKSISAGEAADFSVEFDTDVEIHTIKIMLLDGNDMSILSDYIEIMLADIEYDAIVEEDEELYYEIINDVDEY